MAPVVKAISNSKKLLCVACVTAQQRGMLDQVLELFKITPDFDLDVMTENQSLSDVTAHVISELQTVLNEVKPDLVLVHGDTTTSMAASIAAFYHQIPVGHVEAGLRTNNIYSPWPEEMNRQITSRIATLNFAPTRLAESNLLAENVDKNSIVVTGNTVVDALLTVVSKIRQDSALQTVFSNQFSFLDKQKKLILVTGHRRENFGEGFKNICQAITQLAADPELQIVYPVHLNPNVQQPVYSLLSNLNNVYLIDPLDYLSFVYLMDQSYLILTDSGGIQEEAPSLGKPVLVMRDTTERPEAVHEGTVQLVGTCPADIVREVRQLLDSESDYQTMSHAHNPYGDGHAAERILKRILGEW